MTDLSLLQGQLGVVFHDLSLLERALIHRSYLNENPDSHLESNERLEFLGDALLDFVAAEGLYHRFNGLDEGEMTTLRSALVRQESLARVASSLGLGDFLYLGHGEEKSGGRKRPRNLACALEAVMAAIFIDQGFASAEAFIVKVFISSFQQIMDEGLSDYKSALQELVQARKQGRPSYHLVSKEGPDHDRRFVVEVLIEGEVLGRGRGKNKRSAEKEAAKNALDRLSEV